MTTTRIIHTRHSSHSLPVLLSALLLCALPVSAQDPPADNDLPTHPYHGYTGTVHQVGAVGALNLTAMPNAQAGEHHTQSDLGIGAVYDFRNYVTRQLAYEFVASLMYSRASYLSLPGSDLSPYKFVLPVDGRFYAGPSEDFQMFVGAGLQWSALNLGGGGRPPRPGGPEGPGMAGTNGTAETAGTNGTATPVQPRSNSTHQFSGNGIVGFNILGPQKHMIHFCMATKFHFPISGDALFPSDDKSVVDLSADRGCVVLMGGITLDLDRYKRASAMLNYEYPLGTHHPTRDDGSTDYRLLHQTQTISLGVVFHIGGTR